MEPSKSRTPTKTNKGETMIPLVFTVLMSTQINIEHCYYIGSVPLEYVIYVEENELQLEGTCEELSEYITDKL